MRQLAEIDAVAARAGAGRRQRRARRCRRSNIDALTLTNVEGALLARRLERIAAQQALQEQAIALQALLGTPSNVPAATGATTLGKHP